MPQTQTHFGCNLWRHRDGNHKQEAHLFRLRQLGTAENRVTRVKLHPHQHTHLQREAAGSPVQHEETETCPSGRGERRCPWLVPAWHQPQAYRPDKHGLFGKQALRVPSRSTEGKQLSSGSWPPPFVYFPSIFMPVKPFHENSNLGHTSGLVWSWLGSHCSIFAET